MDNVISIFTKQPLQPTPEVFTKPKAPPKTDADKFVLQTMSFFSAPQRDDYYGTSYTDMEKAHMLLKESHELIYEAYELYVKAMELMKVKP